MTVHEYYQAYIGRLLNIYSQEEATIIAGWAFDKAGYDQSYRRTKADGPYADLPLAWLEDALAALLEYRPVQYVLEEAWFYQLQLKVTEAVLIPRPETEELVHWIIKDHQKSNQPLHLLDVGTGSGCIAIALKKHLPYATITAIDISHEALQVATENGRTHGQPINWQQLDFLNANSWSALPVFDSIVSNPPYIPHAESANMHNNVLLHEPHTALFVPDERPLLFYEQIIAFSADHLQPNGDVYVELHKAHATETKKLFEAAFAEVVLVEDISGNERMIKATRFLKQ